MNFSVSEAQHAKIDQWLHETVYPPIIAAQRERAAQGGDFGDMTGPMIGTDGQVYPYEGAAGGGLTYCFTPTSMGLILTAKYGDQELHLYDDFG